MQRPRSAPSCLPGSPRRLEAAPESWGRQCLSAHVPADHSFICSRRSSAAGAGAGEQRLGLGNERKKLEPGDSNSPGVLETLTLQTGPLPLLQTEAEAPRARAAGPGHSGGLRASQAPRGRGSTAHEERGRAEKGGPGGQGARGPVLTALSVSRVLGNSPNRSGLSYCI